MITGTGNRSYQFLPNASFAILVICISLSGCSRWNFTELERKDLFTISLGTLPGELDWFYRDGFRVAATADIQTRDGLIFLSGGNAGKVMVFNAYGDLITFVYDPARNPALASAKEGNEKRSVSKWPFRSLGAIATFDGGFLVEDKVENRSGAQERDSNINYDRVILRFNQEGRYLGHLGREGFGGAPFPHILSLDVREDGGIVVTCRESTGWVSYWYDEAGHPITTVIIHEDQIPGSYEGLAVYEVKPDPVDFVLYVRVDLYSESLSKPDPRLYALNLTTREYSEPIFLSYVGGNPEKGIPPVPPDYIGTTQNGHHLMLAPEGSDRYRLLVVDKEGRIIQNDLLRVKMSADIYRRFRLQSDGMLIGVFIGNEEATVSRWRLDKIIGDEY